MLFGLPYCLHHISFNITTFNITCCITDFATTRSCYKVLEFYMFVNIVCFMLIFSVVKNGWDSQRSWRFMTEVYCRDLGIILMRVNLNPHKTDCNSSFVFKISNFAFFKLQTPISFCTTRACIKSVVLVIHYLVKKSREIYLVLLL